MTLSSSTIYRGYCAIRLYLESLLLWNRNSLLFYQFCHLAQYRKFLSMVNHVQAESIDSWVCPGVGVIVKCFIVLLQKWSQWIRWIVCIDRDWNTINYGHAERIRNLGSFLYLCYLDLWTTFPVVNPVHVFVAYWALSLSLFPPSLYPCILTPKSLNMFLYGKMYEIGNGYKMSQL